MADANLSRIERNVRRMIDLRAPETDIDAYLQSEGHTPESFRSAMIEPKPRPEPEPSFGRSIGLGTRQAIEGVAAFPGMLYDIAALPFQASIAGMRAAGSDRPYIEPAGKQVAALLDLIGLPKPGTAGERFAGRITRETAALLPTMGAGALAAPARVLAEKIPAQIAGSTSSAIAGQTAQETGAGPVLELLASTAGGVGGAMSATAAERAAAAVRAATMTFTKSGRERMAADVMLRSSADPEGLAARIAQGIDDPTARLPGSPVSTAMAARDPGLMVIEQGLRSDAGRVGGQGGMPGSVAFREIEARRNAARLEELSSSSGSAAGRGTVVRQALEAQEQEARKRVSILFQRIDPHGKTAIPLYPVGAGMFDAAAKRFGPGSGGMPAVVENILDEVRTLATTQKAKVTFEWLQNMRSRLGAEAGKARVAGDERLASTLDDMRGALDRSVGNAAANRQGFTPTQARAWERAIAARRDMGAKFGRDETGASAVGAIIRMDRFGRPMLADERVADRALASIDDFAQTMSAAGPERQQVLEALRGQMIDRMLRASRTGSTVVDAAGNQTTALSPAGFKRFWDDNKAMIDRLFQPAQRRRLELLAADFAETSAVTTTGRARGSDTAQNLSVANLIARATNGLIEPNSPLGQTALGLGPIMRFIYAAPEAATREILVEAMANPRFAEALLRRAGPDAVRQAAGYLSTLGGRIAEAASAASARQAVRTGAAAEAQE